jgi:hypothetical protein
MEEAKNEENIINGQKEIFKYFFGSYVCELKMCFEFHFKTSFDYFLS